MVAKSLAGFPGNAKIQNRFLIFIGAPGPTRTSTPLRATDFESAASTNSATGARARSIGAALAWSSQPDRAPGRSGERQVSLRTGAVLVGWRSVAWGTPVAQADRPFLL